MGMATGSGWLSSQSNSGHRVPPRAGETEVMGEQRLLVPTRDSVLVLGERLDTETGHGNRLLTETTTSVSFVKIFRTKGTGWSSALSPGSSAQTGN